MFRRPRSAPWLRAYGLDYAETLSGFKWVSRVPALLFGFEEAIGYLTHPEVIRDKDGILASADAIAMAREAKLAGKTLWDLLDDASMRFGHFASTQVVVRLGDMAEEPRSSPGDCAAAAHPSSAESRSPSCKTCSCRARLRCRPMCSATPSQTAHAS